MLTTTMFLFFFASYILILDMHIQIFINFHLPGFSCTNWQEQPVSKTELNKKMLAIPCYKKAIIRIIHRSHEYRK